MHKEEDKTYQTWFVRHEGVPLGPLSGAMIRRMLLDRELGLDDEISEDRKTWSPIAKQPEVIPVELRAMAGDIGARAALQSRREHDAQDRAEERRFPLVSLLVVLLLVALLVGFSVWVGIPSQGEDPQCNAAPAPGVNWRNCILLRIDVGSASLAGANLNSTVLRGARLSATDLSGADLRYADLSGGDLSYARLTAATLMGANLQGVDLRGADLSRSDLRFADLSRALIDSAVFEGALLDGVIWVDGATCGEASVGRCQPAKP